VIQSVSLVIVQRIPAFPVTPGLSCKDWTVSLVSPLVPLVARVRISVSAVQAVRNCFRTRVWMLVRTAISRPLRMDIKCVNSVWTTVLLAVMGRPVTLAEMGTLYRTGCALPATLIARPVPLLL
jgi:hypothetical protein